MKSKTILILMILIATIIPGALGEWLIVSIPDSESDVWMTEIGNIFAYESSVRLLHGEIGLHSFIRFEDVGLAKNDKINYATLYVHAGYDQGESPDPGASVTIYGIDEPDCTPFSYSGNVWSLSRSYTSASVNWNLSTWGYGWHSVNVTDIVKEIVNQYAWEENNSMGFQILGATDSGHEVRTFEDIDHQYSGNHAYLYIQFNDAGERPPGIPDEAIWMETYGEWDIWNFTIIGDVNYTDMTEIDTPGKITIYNETVFSWTSINKNTLNVSVGYLTSMIGIDNVTSYSKDFNFTVTVDSHNAAQTNPNCFFLLGKLEQIGTLTQIFDGNELICFDIYTTSTAHYKFIAREYGTGTGNGNLSATLDENTWYQGKVILDGTLWRLEVYDYETGAIITASQRTLSGIKIRRAIMPMSGQGHGLSGSVDSGWMVQALSFTETEYYLVDENGTVIDTWTQNGENFTDIDDLKDFVDDYLDPLGGDPLDPDPGTQGWTTEGPFTRFKMRLYILFIGLGCVFIPLWAMAYKKFDAVGYAGCLIIIVTGVGLLWSITGI